MLANTFSFHFTLMDCFFNSCKPQLNVSNCDSRDDNRDSASEFFFEFVST